MLRAFTIETKQFQPELYRSYLRVLARVALRSGGALKNKVDASDIVQEALLKAIVALPQFRGRTHQEFAAWLRAILANKFTDVAKHFAKQKRDVALEQSYLETLNDSADRFEALIAADVTRAAIKIGRAHV